MDDTWNLFQEMSSSAAFFCIVDRTQLIAPWLIWVLGCSAKCCFVVWSLLSDGWCSAENQDDVFEPTCSQKIFCRVIEPLCCNNLIMIIQVLLIVHAYPVM